MLILKTDRKGERMAVVEVIKYEGSPDVFAWKYPNEELGTWSQLIVNELQERIPFKGGMALDTFGSGRHTLEIANILVLNAIGVFRERQNSALNVASSCGFRRKNNDVK